MQTPVGIRSGPSGFFFGLCVQSKVVSLQMDEEIETSWISTAPVLHNEEEGMYVTYGPVLSNTVPNYMSWCRTGCCHELYLLVTTNSWY